MYSGNKHRSTLLHQSMKCIQCQVAFNNCNNNLYTSVLRSNIKFLGNLNNGKPKNTLSIKEMFVFSFQYGQLTEGRTYYKNALSETTSDLSYLISNFFPKTGEFELLQTPRNCLAYIFVLSFNLFPEPSLHILTLNIHINHQRIFSV